MPPGPDPIFMRNDLKVVTIFMVIILLVSVGLELRPRDIPKPEEPQGTTNPPQDQPPEPVTTEVLSRSGYTNEGQSSQEKFGLGYPLVTMVKIELKWTDDYGNNDVFKLELSREDAALGQEQGSTGGITIEVNAGTDENLAGNFTATVTCISAPGVVSPSPVDRDKGNSWDLTVSATYQEAAP
jgi:hypothetical protein